MLSRLLVAFTTALAFAALAAPANAQPALASPAMPNNRARE